MVCVNAICNMILRTVMNLLQCQTIRVISYCQRPLISMIYNSVDSSSN